jgi:hypothetical protein
MSVVITPTLTLTVDKTAASPGETVTLSGSLNMTRENGDVNGDNIVDVFDVVQVALSYGARRGEPNYNPNVDLNNDGVIDIFDLVKLATVWGQNSGLKPVTLYVSSDGVNWTPITQLTTVDGYPYRYGSFTYSYTIPANTPVPSTLYFMAYFPGGVYGV